MAISSLHLFQTIDVHSNDVTAVDFCKDFLATGSNDKSIGIFQFQEDLEQFSVYSGSPLLGHDYGVTRVRFSPCGEYLVSSSRDGKIVVWSLKIMKIFRVLQHEDFLWIRAVAFSKTDSYLATAGESSTIEIWNYLDFSSKRCRPGTRECSFTCIIFSLNNEYVISGDLDGSLMSWRANALLVPAICIIIEAHDLGVFDCDISAASGCTEGNSILVTCGNENDVKLWTLREDGQIEFLLKYSGHSGIVSECRFITQTSILSIGSDRKLHFWNQTTGAAQFIYPSKQKCLLCCAVSGSFIAVGSTDHSLLIWQLKSQQNILHTPFSKIGETNPHSWTVNDVYAWMEEYFSQYSHIFRENSVDGEKLAIIADTDLHKMGIADPVIQKEILAHIAKAWSENYHTVPENTDIPNDYLCPITHELMKDPVIVADGFTYDRDAIETWFQNCKTIEVRSPVTNEILTSTTLISNKILAHIIRNFSST